MNETNTFRKKHGSDIWHFHRECPDWPAENFIYKKLPDGETPSDGALCGGCIDRVFENPAPESPLRNA